MLGAEVSMLGWLVGRALARGGQGGAWKERERSSLNEGKLEVSVVSKDTGRVASKQDMFCTSPGTPPHPLMRFGEGTESLAYRFYANRTGAPSPSRASRRRTRARSVLSFMITSDLRTGSNSESECSQQV